MFGSVICDHLLFFFFFFNDTATTEIYTLSLHDALPISQCLRQVLGQRANVGALRAQHLELEARGLEPEQLELRSEEHTSELQSRLHLVCRLLLEKKKKQAIYHKTALPTPCALAAT